MERVAIVVVTHQSANVIGACLDSIAPFSDIEVIVVDNSSSDSTLIEVTRRVNGRNVHLLANPHNAGFAAAVNQGVQATSAPLVLLLNPDARLETSVEALVDCFTDPKTGGAAGLLTDANGEPQTGFTSRNLPGPATLAFEVLGFNHFWPRNPLNWHYRCLGNDPMVSAFIEQPPGAFFMFRRTAWQQLGGFDERFWPVWFEDVDFCARLKSAGLSIRFQPAARAIHQGGHSVGRIPLQIREKYWYGSLLKYAAKHYHRVAFGSVCLAVVAGAASRAIFALPREGWKVFEVYSNVIRLAFAHLRKGSAPGSDSAGLRRDK